MIRIALFFLVLFLLIACAPPGDGVVPDSTDRPNDETINSDTPIPPADSDPLAPQPEDGSLLRGPVFIDTADILAAESYPVQYFLVLKGNLPTPCHHLRTVVNEPNSQNVIQVDVYSVTDPEMLCAQVLQSFDISFRLPDSMATGTYSVSINSEMLLELTVE